MFCTALRWIKEQISCHCKHGKSQVHVALHWFYTWMSIYQACRVTLSQWKQLSNVFCILEELIQAHWSQLNTSGVTLQSGEQKHLESLNWSFKDIWKYTVQSSIVIILWWICHLSMNETESLTFCFKGAEQRLCFCSHCVHSNKSSNAVPSLFTFPNKIILIHCFAAFLQESDLIRISYVSS